MGHLGSEKTASSVVAQWPMAGVQALALRSKQGTVENRVASGAVDIISKDITWLVNESRASAATFCAEGGLRSRSAAAAAASFDKVGASALNRSSKSLRSHPKSKNADDVHCGDGDEGLELAANDRRVECKTAIEATRTINATRLQTAAAGQRATLQLELAKVSPAPWRDEILADVFAEVPLELWSGVWT